MHEILLRDWDIAQCRRLALTSVRSWIPCSAPQKEDDSSHCSGFHPHLLWRDQDAGGGSEGLLSGALKYPVCLQGLVNWPQATQFYGYQLNGGILEVCTLLAELLAPC